MWDMEGLMTVREVAVLCQVHRKTVTRAIARGELRAARLGEAGAFRIRAADLDAWIEARAIAPSARPAPGPDARPAARPVRGWLTA